MSYEGYNIFLCVNGHRNDWDCMDGTPGTCEDCGASIAWTYAVDQTNDSGVEPALVEHKSAETETCECCSHTKQVAEETYVIPMNAGRLLVAKEEVNVPFSFVGFKDMGSTNEEFLTFSCTNITRI